MSTLASFDVVSGICQALLAGKQAEVLNKILADMFLGQPISEVKLKEVLGHSPLQVLAGAVLGVFTGIMYIYKFGSGYASLA